MIRGVTATGRALVLVYSAGLVVLLLYPFRFELPVFIGNSVSWQDGRVAFPEPGLMRSTGSAESLIRSLTGAGAFSIELVVTSFSLEQTGDPSRIVVLSDGPSNRNFVVGQYEQDLVFRVRTGRNVHADLVAAAHRFPNVTILAEYIDRNRKELGRDPRKGESLIMIQDFFAVGERRHVVFSYDGRTIQIFGDGKMYFSGPVEDDSFLRNWNSGYSMAIGNEVDGSRPWLGRIDVLRFFDRALSPQDMRTAKGSGSQAHNTGGAGATAELRVVGDRAALWTGAVAEERRLFEFDRPERFIYARKKLLGIGRRGFVTFEAAANVLLLIPFGAIAASWTGEARALRLRGLARIIGLALLFSLIVEVGQFFIETRYSSIVDVSSYLLGALVGWVLWIRVVRPKAS